MSSIPNAKMKHAHAHEGEHADDTHQHGTEGHPPAGTKNANEKAEKSFGGKLSEQAKGLGERAQELAEEAVDAVKERPGTAAAIGAAVLAGAAALIGAPAIARAVKGATGNKPAAKKPAARKSAAKKPATPKS